VQLGEEGVRSFELDVFYDAAGWRVHHLTVFDEMRTCPLRVQGLHLLRRWSRAHPLHHPVIGLIEPEGFYLPGRITDGPIPGHRDSLEAEIRSVLGPDQLLTPDDVRGAHATLPEALAAEGSNPPPRAGERKMPRGFAMIGGSPTSEDRCRVGRSSCPPRALSRSGQGDFHHPAPPRRRLVATAPRSGP
jgi:hypothetical protein